MGQNTSHHNRAVKHRQSTRSLPDVANHRLLDEEARWAAYASGQYLAVGCGRPTQGEPSWPMIVNDPLQRSRSLAPKARKSASMQSTGDGLQQQQNCQSFSSFERSYLAKCPQAVDNHMRTRQGPRSFDGHYFTDKSKARAHRYPPGSGTFHSKGSQRTDQNGYQGDDCNWSDVASDMYRINKKRDQTYRIHKTSENNGKCSGRLPRKGGRLLIDGSRPGLLDQVPENSPCSTTEPPTARRHGRQASSPDRMLFRVDSSDISWNSPPSSKTTDKKTPTFSGELELTGGTDQTYPPLSNNGFSSSPNECERSLRRELNAERSLRLKLEQKGIKDRECIEDLRQKNECLKIEAENLARCLQQKNVGQNETDLERRINELQEENKRLEKEKLQQKVAYDRCLEDVAGRVARAVINEKTLRAECVRLQKRVYEVEWKEKVGGLLATNKDMPKTFATESGCKNAHNSSSGGSLFTCKVHPPSPPRISNGTPKARGRDDNSNFTNFLDAMGVTVEEEYAELLSNVIKAKGHHPTALQDALASSVTLSPMSNGGEAMCSRPASFSFDAVAAAVSPPINDVRTTGSSLTHPTQLAPLLLQTVESVDVKNDSQQLVTASVGINGNSRRTSGDASHCQTNGIVVNFVRLFPSSMPPTLDVGINDRPRLVDHLLSERQLAVVSNRGFYDSLSILGYEAKSLHKKKMISVVVRGKSKSTETLNQGAVCDGRKWKSDSCLLGKTYKCPSLAFDRVVEEFLYSGNHLTEFERDVVLQKLDRVKLRFGLTLMPPPKPTKAFSEDIMPCSPNVGHLNHESNFNRPRANSCGKDDIAEIKNESSIDNTFVSLALRSKDSSANTSYTSDDSSECYGEKLLMRDSWNHLKRKKNFGKSAVVRYRPSDCRAVILNKGSCMLRNYVYHRFGRWERDALAHFDFLDSEEAVACNVHHSDAMLSSPPPAIAKRRLSRYDQHTNAKAQRCCSSFDADDSIKSSTITISAAEEGFYENLPFHRFCCTLSHDDRRSSSASLGDGTSTSPSPANHRRQQRRQLAMAENGNSPRSSSSLSDGGSSLFLSQLNLAAERMIDDRSSSGDNGGPDDSFTSGSSISVL